MWRSVVESDTGWIGAAPDDDLDARLAAEADAFAPDQPRVETLLGPIAPAALGSTLVGERLLGAENGDAGTVDPAADRERLLAELDDVAASGTRAILAVDRVGNDGAIELLRWVAARAEVHLLVATNASDHATGGETTAAQTMLDALTVGLGGTASKAGAIAVAFDPGGEVVAAVGPRGTSDVRIPSDSPSLLDAVATVHLSTGAPVLLQAGNLDAAIGAATALTERGVSSDRMAILGCAHGDDGSALRQALDLGITLAFDQVLAFGRDEAMRQASEVAALVAAGYGGRIVLATGLTAPIGLLAFGGGPGWAALSERFPLALMEHGLAATDVRRLLADNPARLLTIDPGRQGQ